MKPYDESDELPTVGRTFRVLLNYGSDRPSSKRQQEKNFCSD